MVLHFVARRELDTFIVTLQATAIYEIKKSAAFSYSRIWGFAERLTTKPH
jgi:hypothetical protein